MSDVRIMTPEGIVNVSAVQRRAEERLKTAVGVPDEVKAAVGLLATVLDELDERLKREEATRRSFTY